MKKNKTKKKQVYLTPLLVHEKLLNIEIMPNVNEMGNIIKLENIFEKFIYSKFKK